MQKIKLIEKNVREGKSGSLEINSGYDAYYELVDTTLVLDVSMKLSDGAVGARWRALVEAKPFTEEKISIELQNAALKAMPFTEEKISIELQNAALKAMGFYIQKDLKTPASDDGASTKKVRYEVDLAARKLLFERHFNSAAANILIALGEDY